MVTDQQVRRLFTVQNKYEHQYQAADVAGISGKTAHKYLKNGKLPSQCKVEHTWPTRQDPFADDWVFVEQMLEDTQATLEAKTLFEYLQRAYPGSVLITSNLPFSKWEMIFKDPMTTAAAIGREKRPR
jgi:hypothetical protein